MSVINYRLSIINHHGLVIKNYLFNINKS